MKTIRCIVITVIAVLASTAAAFADATGGPSQGIIHIDGVPSWVWRVVLLLILFVAAILPMTGDLKEYMAMKRYMRKKKSGK